MHIEIRLWDADSCTATAISLPGKNEVCEQCNGEGTHVNPAIDGNGISPEQFDEDLDFAEGYFSGRYDVQCESCHGRNVMAVVDESRLTRAQEAVYERYCDQEERRQAQEAEDHHTQWVESGCPRD